MCKVIGSCDFNKLSNGLCHPNRKCDNCLISWNLTCDGRVLYFSVIFCWLFGDQPYLNLFIPFNPIISWLYYDWGLII